MKKSPVLTLYDYNFMVCVLWLNNINSSPCRQKIYTKMVSSLCSGEKSALFKYSRTSLSLTRLSRASHYLELKLFYLGYTFLVSYYQLHVSWTPNISNYFLFPLRVRDSRIQLYLPTVVKKNFVNSIIQLLNDHFYPEPVPMQYIYRTRDKVWDFYEVRMWLSTQYLIWLHPLSSRNNSKVLLLVALLMNHKELSDLLLALRT